MAQRSVALSDAVMFGATEVMLLQNQMLGLGESGAVLDENRSRGSNEHIGVRVKIRVRICFYLLTKLNINF